MTVTDRNTVVNAIKKCNTSSSIEPHFSGAKHWVKQNGEKREDPTVYIGHFRSFLKHQKRRNMRKYLSQI